MSVFYYSAPLEGSLSGCPFIKSITKTVTIAEKIKYFL